VYIYFFIFTEGTNNSNKNNNNNSTVYKFHDLQCLLWYLTTELCTEYSGWSFFAVGVAVIAGGLVYCVIGCIYSCPTELCKYNDNLVESREMGERNDTGDTANGTPQGQDVPVCRS